MDSLWDFPDFDEHELVHFVTDRESGLRAIVAVHSTRLGPGAGGTRFWHYGRPDEAVADVLRLSRGMSYKNAMAGLALGGGKAVILADAARAKTKEMLARFGRAVEGLGGQYVTAEDVGMSVADMVAISKQTRYVAGLPVAEGSVASGLARRAAEDGARLSIADVDGAKARSLAGEVGGEVVAPEDVLALEADILSPNALGAILNAETIPQLRVAIVAGGANNQLATPEDGDRIHRRGILYAPDYVINAGGIINVSTEYLKDGDASVVRERLERIPVRLDEIWDESIATGRNPAAVADAMARRLIGRG